MKIGDYVREFVGGPIMRIVGWLDSGRVAICEIIGNGTWKTVAVIALTLATAFSNVHGHAAEDAPEYPVIEKPIVATAIGASGASGAAAQPHGLTDESGWVPQVQSRPWQVSVFSHDDTLPFPPCSD